MRDTYSEHSEPVLALEEPEAHLHPQAARALWQKVTQLPGQRIISSHSPYFVQNVPFRKLRVFRKDGVGVRVHTVPANYSAVLPNKAELRAFVAKNPAKFTYRQSIQELVVGGKLSTDEYRELLACYTSAEERTDVHPVIVRLRESSRFYMSDSELDDLQTAVRRIRGEILFARAWLLCEGQSEYVLLHGFAELLGTPLDAAGVAVVDFQNSGRSPDRFAVLAQNLGFPWVLQCDGDAEGNTFVAAVTDAFAPTSIATLCHQLPVQDLEAFLVRNGLEQQLDVICRATNRRFTTVQGDAGYLGELTELLRQIKGQWPSMLIENLKNLIGPPFIPDFFVNLIGNCIDAAR